MLVFVKLDKQFYFPTLELLAAKQAQDYLTFTMFLF